MFERLKMIDNDGRFTYSSTILIKNPNASQNVWIGANPFHDAINIRLARSPKQDVKVELINTAGAKVYYEQYKNSGEILINLTGTPLSPGIYVLKTIVDGKTYINKLVKQ